jgi:hypothetical protein
MLNAIHDQLSARNRDINAHGEELALMLPALRFFHRNPAAHYPVGKLVEFRYFIADFRFYCIRMRYVLQGDLWRDFHGVSPFPRKFLELS